MPTTALRVLSGVKGSKVATSPWMRSFMRPPRFALFVCFDRAAEWSRHGICAQQVRSIQGDPQSDEKRAPGHLSHEGPELLRWALFEAALSAARAGSPDHAYYLQVAERIDHNRACLSVARKLCRRAYHILRELGDEALAPIDAPVAEEVIAAAA